MIILPKQNGTSEQLSRKETWRRLDDIQHRSTRLIELVISKAQVSINVLGCWMPGSKSLHVLQLYASRIKVVEPEQE